MRFVPPTPSNLSTPGIQARLGHGAQIAGVELLPLPPHVLLQEAAARSSQKRTEGTGARSAWGAAAASQPSRSGGPSPLLTSRLSSRYVGNLAGRCVAVEDAKTARSSGDAANGAPQPLRRYGPNVRFQELRAAAVSPRGSAFVVDGNAVCHVGPSGVVSTVVGVHPSCGPARGRLGQLTLHGPRGLAASDSSAEGRARDARATHGEYMLLPARSAVLYVADTMNDSVRRIDVANGEAVTIAAVARPVAVCVLFDSAAGKAAPQHQTQRRPLGQQWRLRQRKQQRQGQEEHEHERQEQEQQRQRQQKQQPPPPLVGVCVIASVRPLDALPALVATSQQLILLTPPRFAQRVPGGEPKFHSARLLTFPRSPFAAVACTPCGMIVFADGKSVWTIDPSTGAQTAVLALETVAMCVDAWGSIFVADRHGQLQVLSPPKRKDSTPEQKGGEAAAVKAASAALVGMNKVGLGSDFKWDAMVVTQAKDSSTRPHMYTVSNEGRTLRKSSSGSSLYNHQCAPTQTGGTFSVSFRIDATAGGDDYNMIGLKSDRTGYMKQAGCGVRPKDGAVWCDNTKQGTLAPLTQGDVVKVGDGHVDQQGDVQLQHGGQDSYLEPTAGRGAASGGVPQDWLASLALWLLCHLLHHGNVAVRGGGAERELQVGRANRDAGQGQFHAAAHVHGQQRGPHAAEVFVGQQPLQPPVRPDADWRHVLGVVPDRRHCGRGRLQHDRPEERQDRLHEAGRLRRPAQGWSRLV